MSAPNIPTRIMMFRDFVPDRVRVFLCLFFAVTFQFSGGIYLASVSQMVGSLALMQEDIMMAGYASFVGTTVVFPILFRLKFRFTSRSIFLMVCPALIVCNLITMSTGSLPVLVGVCFIAGSSVCRTCSSVSRRLVILRCSFRSCILSCWEVSSCRGWRLFI